MIDCADDYYTWSVIYRLKESEKTIMRKRVERIIDCNPVLLSRLFKTENTNCDVNKQAVKYKNTFFNSINLQIDKLRQVERMIISRT